jgi:pimeloyl-ACP methyl ester carboxylesterase
MLEDGDFVNIDAKSLFWKFYNKDLLQTNKSILVFLHEGLGCSSQWKDIPQVLSDELQIAALVYDRYGYGLSQEISEIRTKYFLKDEAVKVLPQLFQQLQLDDYAKILYGHSDGGTIALYYAALVKDRIKAIITEAAHVFVEEITLKGLHSVVEYYDSGKLSDKLKQFHNENTENMFRSWTDVWLSEEMRNWNIEELLTHINCPVLVIQGENDNYGSLKQVNSIEENVSGAVESLVIPDCGHIPHHQSRDIVVKYVTDFIKQYV